MKTLCIYCCGGTGREIADLSQRLNRWDKVVFIDDDAEKRLIDNVNVYTLEEILKLPETENLEFIVTAGEPLFRKHIYEKLLKNKLKCTNIIEPSFVLSKSSSVNNGTIIQRGAVVTCNVHIGFGCLINQHVVIGHDVTIGDFCVLSPNATISGDVIIKNGTYVASGAIIRNGVTIGENSIIGMGAVVLRDADADSVMVGNPAKLLRKNIDKRVFERT